MLVAAELSCPDNPDAAQRAKALVVCGTVRGVLFAAVTIALLAICVDIGGGLQARRE